MRALGGACRDWRGVLVAAHNRAAFSQVFDVLHPRHLETLARGAEAWADRPEVTTPLLKLFAELVLQRGQRINFGSNSPNGVLLFRSASFVLTAYGRRMGQYKPPPSSDAYAIKYKAVAVCTAVLARALDGGYVNFGVFALYNDKALESASNEVLGLLLSVPPEELFVRGWWVGGADLARTSFLPSPNADVPEACPAVHGDDALALPLIHGAHHGAPSICVLAGRAHAVRRP